MMVAVDFHMHSCFEVEMLPDIQLDQRAYKQPDKIQFKINGILSLSTLSKRILSQTPDQLSIVLKSRNMQNLWSFLFCNLSLSNVT